MKNVIRTTHNLDFEACPWPRDPSITAWRVGTCNGVYQFEKGILCLISIHNDQPGNGHLEDAFQWFEDTVKNRGNGVIIIMEFMNERFKTHCIEKRGYVPIPGTNNAMKVL